MKKYILKISAFLLVVAMLDILCGYLYDHIENRAKGGATYKNRYLEECCKDEILILGSSRAARHYVPRVIQDSLGLSCYNGGEPGCGVVTMYPRYRMVKQRKLPRLIIYEVTPTFDYSIFDDYSKYLGPIRQSSDKEPVKEAFYKFSDNLEPVRLLSKMYRNNSCIVNNVMDMIVIDTINRGYLPMDGCLNPTTNSNIPLPHTLTTDSLKWSYMKDFFEGVKSDGVGLCIIISPIYFLNKKHIEEWQKEYSLIRDYCSTNNIALFDEIYMEGLSNDSTKFHDYMHLNDSGAVAFTRAIIPELRGLLNNY